MGDGDKSYRVLGGDGGSKTSDGRGCWDALVAWGDACLDDLNENRRWMLVNRLGVDKSIEICS